jgi:membrane protein
MGARDRNTKIRRADRAAAPTPLGWLTPFTLGVFVGLSVALRTALTPEPAAPPKAAPPRLRGAPRDPTRSRRLRSALIASARSFMGDQIPAVAAGVTFFCLLALFPALSAFVSLYGLVGDVDQARRQLAGLNGLMPGGAISVLADQLDRLGRADHGGLGLTFAVSLAISLWSSNAGVKALMAGLNDAYEATEHRNFITLNLRSLGFTIGLMVFAVVAVLAVVAAPGTLALVGLGGLAGAAALRWPLVLVVVVAMITLLYRYGPCRPRARWRWLTPGCLVAAVAWVAMSLGFSWYVANFGHYDRTYGSLGAIVGFLTWIWLSTMVVLYGAELNAELDL